ncbi:hypothetical protein [Mesorhizobium sp.]|uniref:hypothetical protein n=1 Tax=Mesorhizobium sp. TaxID=1871066 RepID=UPI000FE48F06|nr:hypothetical protein [Mesorhizobium sp.]RWI62910.1 MAG: hypothetical protein EOR18_32295 [Mesorhizobium sp.]TJV94717.1 MAG: hypothetical protein E5X52_27425 [Mesorhizobium sp.]
MDHIVRLDSRQETALQAAADSALHNGDVMKALKEMMVLNGHLHQKLDDLGEASTRPAAKRAYR